jgi:hypothetical protein
VTSRLVLDELDLDLPSSRLLVAFLVIFVIVVPSAVDSVLVSDERVVADRPNPC